MPNSSNWAGRQVLASIVNRSSLLVGDLLLGKLDVSPLSEPLAGAQRELNSLSASIRGHLTAKASWSTLPASRTTRLHSLPTEPPASCWPGIPITLRQGARVIEDSRRLRLVSS